MPSLRHELGETLVELGKEYRDLVVITGDLGKSTGVSAFEAYPDRYFNLGISEQDMIGTAAGLASAGKIPLVCTYAIFLAGRAWEQIRNSVARDRLNAKMIATHSGISPSADGSSHQCFEDLALIRSIPGTTIVVPADASEMRYAIREAVNRPGPFYIRLGRGDIPENVGGDDALQIGKVRQITEGSDVGIIASGLLVPEALEAVSILRRDGIQASVLDMHTIKPPDQDALVEIAQRTGAIVTAEDHNILGGLGSTVAEILCARNPVPVEMVGIRDRFGESGDIRQLMRIHGLTASHIAYAARNAVKRKQELARSRDTS